MRATTTFFARAAIMLGLLVLAGPGLKLSARAEDASSILPARGVETLWVPPIDPVVLKLRDKMQSATFEKRWTFAEPAYVSAGIGEFGQWEDLGGNRLRWRLGVEAPGSTDINIGFTNIFLPRECSLRLYSADRSYEVGPYTFSDNEEHGQLWTPVLPGERVEIEAEMPAAVAGQFELAIGQVNRGYRDVCRRGFVESDKQGACNIDVICPSADAWRNEIRSVVRYTISGAYLCTGSLVMNQRADYRAFVLTANHCLDTATEAASVVVYWNYQAPTCGTLGGGSLSQNQSGSSLRATSASSDFTLLELSSVPSAAYNVYYAGWDRSGGAAASSVGIHHPGGAVKAICFYNGAVQSTAYYGYTVDAGANHWRVVDWSQGTTEGGSSGSGLWDATSHRIIGQLHGGSAACGNDLSDWYGKLATSWTGGGTAATRLSSWLDPDGTGLTGMDGANPGANSAPTDIGLSNASVAENEPTDRAIGTLKTTDPDAGDTHTYALVESANYPDNAFFAIPGNGNTLRAAISFDYESRTSYSIRIRSQDQTGLSFTKTFTIAITAAPGSVVYVNYTNQAPYPNGSVHAPFPKVGQGYAAAHTGNTIRITGAAPPGANYPETLLNMSKPVTLQTADGSGVVNIGPP